MAYRKATLGAQLHKAAADWATQSRRLVDDLDGFERYEDSAMFEAIRVADCWRANKSEGGTNRRGDLSRLVRLLRHQLTNDGLVLTRAEADLLIDLLKRHRLKAKPGGRPLPTYKRASWAELKLEFAAERVRRLMRDGLSLDAAIWQVFDDEGYGVPAKALRSYLRGRLHPERRRPR
ncbi:MAG TPA: hypothetical protein VES00_02715 [Burkholderiaceae bacterium]|nr:hypothetical protein [Burkholderiaceae bacterium]